MINIEGKNVLTELVELVEPAHTALIVIDMQCDFIEPDGLFATLGIDLSMYAKSRPRLASLLGAARMTGTTVVHLQNTALPDRMSDSPAQIRFNLRMHKDARRNQPPLRYTIPGTPGHEFTRDFTPLQNELVVRAAIHGQSVEIGSVQNPYSASQQARGECRRASMDAVGDTRQPFGTVVDGIHGGRHRAPGLHADVHH